MIHRIDLTVKKELTKNSIRKKKKAEKSRKKQVKKGLDKPGRNPYNTHAKQRRYGIPDLTVKKELTKKQHPEKEKMQKKQGKKGLTNRSATLIIPTQNKEGTASPTSPGAAGGRGQDGLKL